MLLQLLLPTPERRSWGWGREPCLLREVQVEDRTRPRPPPPPFELAVNYGWLYERRKVTVVTPAKAVVGQSHLSLSAC